MFILDTNIVSELRKAKAGKANHARAIWPLVILQYWLESWAPERAG